MACDARLHQKRDEILRLCARNELLQGWFVRNLQIIGEATRAFPDRICYIRSLAELAVSRGEFNATQKEDA
jgi:hypothetical protein